MLRFGKVARRNPASQSVGLLTCQPDSLLAGMLSGQLDDMQACFLTTHQVILKASLLACMIACRTDCLQTCRPACLHVSRHDGVMAGLHAVLPA
jgi:hypothetical protein